MTEVKTLRPLWHHGKPVEAGEVILLPDANAAYLVGIGRVERVTEVQAPAKPRPARTKKVES